MQVTLFFSHRLFSKDTFRFELSMHSEDLIPNYLDVAQDLNMQGGIYLNRGMSQSCMILTLQEQY